MYTAHITPPEVKIGDIPIYNCLVSDFLQYNIAIILLILIPYLLFLLYYTVLIRVGGIIFSSINIYSYDELLCVDSYHINIYYSAYVLYIYVFIFILLILLAYIYALIVYL